MSMRVWASRPARDSECSCLGGPCASFCHNPKLQDTGCCLGKAAPQAYPSLWTGFPKIWASKLWSQKTAKPAHIICKPKACKRHCMAQTSTSRIQVSLLRTKLTLKSQWLLIVGYLERIMGHSRVYWPLILFFCLAFQDAIIVEKVNPSSDRGIWGALHLLAQVAACTALESGFRRSHERL